MSNRKRNIVVFIVGLFGILLLFVGLPLSTYLDQRNKLHTIIVDGQVCQLVYVEDGRHSWGGSYGHEEARCKK